jgi:HAD superfamily hydrolase (TIGR01509 family)
MLKAILFDMDGVLYDSMPNHVKAWSETMLSVGIEASEEEFYLFEGRTGGATIQILFNRAFGRDASSEEIKTIYGKKMQRFIELEYPESKPMPGALEVLEKTKDLGLQRIVVTGSGQYSLLGKLEKHYPAFFDKELMVTAYDVQFGKPHPEPYLMGLKKGRLQAEEALVVENAPLGIKAGRAAGIYTVAVNTGPLPNHVLQEAGAQIIYPSLKAFASDLDRLACVL